MNDIPIPRNNPLLRNLFFDKYISPRNANNVGIASNIPHRDEKIIGTGLKRYRIIAKRAFLASFVWLKTVCLISRQISMSAIMIGSLIVKYWKKIFFVNV